MLFKQLCFMLPMCIEALIELCTLTGDAFSSLGLWVSRDGSAGCFGLAWTSSDRDTLGMVRVVREGDGGPGKVRGQLEMGPMLL